MHISYLNCSIRAALAACGLRARPAACCPSEAFFPTGPEPRPHTRPQIHCLGAAGGTEPASINPAKGEDTRGSWLSGKVPWMSIFSKIAGQKCRLSGLTKNDWVRHPRDGLATCDLGAPQVMCMGGSNSQARWVPCIVTGKRVPYSQGAALGFHPHWTPEKPSLGSSPCSSQTV